jgi:hypothetical protein
MPKRKPKPSVPRVHEAATATPSPTVPLVFISHDSRDAELAEAFSKLLGSVSAGVLKTFRSSDRRGAQGIEYGVEWYPEIMSRLDASSDVVCLLTPHSVDRPWILYEAGVAKGKLNTPVYGIALGLPVSRVNTTGPFAQFQNSDDNEESLTKLVLQLLRRIPGSEPDRDAILIQVRAFKSSIAKLVPETSNEEPEGTGEASTAKLFEEIKVMFQDLPGRIEHRVGHGSKRSHRMRHIQSRMMHDVMRMTEESGDPIGLLLLASFFRDEAPWVYEIAREITEAIRRGQSAKAHETVRLFHHALEMVERGDVGEECRACDIERDSGTTSRPRNRGANSASPSICFPLTQEHRLIADPDGAPPTVQRGRPARMAATVSFEWQWRTPSLIEVLLCGLGGSLKPEATSVARQAVVVPPESLRPCAVR